MSFRVDELDWHSKVFMNRELVHTYIGGGPVYFKAKLKKGWNELLVKIATGSNSWTFNLSVMKPDGLKCSLKQGDIN